MNEEPALAPAWKSWSHTIGRTALGIVAIGAPILFVVFTVGLPDIEEAPLPTASEATEGETTPGPGPAETEGETAVEGAEGVAPGAPIAPTLGPAIPAPSFANTQLPGVVRPAKSVWISAPIDGTVETVHARQGDRVTAKTPLFSLNEDIARAATQSAAFAANREAAIEQAAAQVELAETKVRRYRSATEKGGKTEAQLADALTELKIAQATLKSAHEQKEQHQENYKLEQERLERLVVRAPFDGVIVREAIERGAMVSPAKELLLLVDLATLEAELQVPVAYYDQMTVGKEVRLRALAPLDRELAATIDFRDPVLNAAAGSSVRVIVRIANEDLSLPAGFVVELIED